NCHHQSAVRRMDVHIRIRAAHRRIARPARSSPPHSGDERRELPPHTEQESTAAFRSGAKPNSKAPIEGDLPPKYESTWKHKNKSRLQSPFLLTRLVHFHAALCHNLSPPLTADSGGLRSGLG